MLILHDGIFVTMDGEKNIYKDYALVIEGNKITEMGSRNEILKKYENSGADLLSCSGKAVFPGFINTHIHTAQSIVRGVAEDMGRAPSYTSSVPQGDDLTENESYIFSLLGAATALRFGSTCISDNYANSLSNAKAFGTLGIRAFVSERVHDADFHGLADGIYETNDALGNELFEKNIALFEKYNDPEGLINPCIGPHAPDTCSRKLLLRLADAAEQYKAPVTTHLAQSRMELRHVNDVYGISPTMLLKECGLLNDRLLAAHGVFLEDCDIDELNAANASIVHIPEGNAKAGSIARIGDIQEKGLNVTIGTDNGAANMIENMRMALVSGRILRHCVTQPKPEDILSMAVTNGARAFHMEEKLGSIEINKLADLVLVDYEKLHMTPCTNVIGNLVHLGLGNDVDTVIVNGKIVVENGKVLGIDEKEVMRDARRIAQFKWSKSNPDLDHKYMYVF